MIKLEDVLPEVMRELLERKKHADLADKVRSEFVKGADAPVDTEGVEYSYALRLEA